MQVKNSYLNGHKLIGDDFDENQIAKWFKEELEYSKLYPFERFYCPNPWCHK